MITYCLISHVVDFFLSGSCLPFSNVTSSCLPGSIWLISLQPTQITYMYIIPYSGGFANYNMEKMSFTTLLYVNATRSFLNKIKKMAANSDHLKIKSAILPFPSDNRFPRQFLWDSYRSL